MIKTKTIPASSEIYCDCIGGEHAWITNLSTNTVYVSKNPNITPEADDTKQILAGESAMLLDCCKKVYLYATASSKVQIEGTNQVNVNFRKAAKGGGGSGGSGTTDYTELSNKPSINSVSLEGNKTFGDLGLSDLPVTAVTGTKSIALTDWTTETGEQPITTIEAAVLLNTNDSYKTVDTSTRFLSFIDREAYPKEDFTATVSVDGTTEQTITFSSDEDVSGTRVLTYSGTLGTIRVQLTANRLRVRSTNQPLYFHELIVDFDDYFICEYAVDDITTKSIVEIWIDDDSKENVECMQLLKRPTISNGKVIVSAIDLPADTVNTSYRIVQTSADQAYAEIKNAYGNIVTYSVAENGVDDNDNTIPTTSQVKDYLINGYATEEYVNGLISAMSMTIAAEVTARENADTTLQGNIDTVSNTVGDISTILSSVVEVSE